MSNKNNFSALSAFQFAKKVTPYVTAVQTATKVASVIHTGEKFQVANDPYYQHMPKTNAAEATIYAAKYGGTSFNDLP